MTKTATKRAPNFSSKEEHLLVTLAAKHKAKIECKRTDASSNENKVKAWQTIAEEFNIAVVDGSRDVAVLKNKFENLKKRTKKKFAEEKNFARGTGGGPHKNFNITDEDNIIKDMITTQVTGRASEFDGDNTIADPYYSHNESLEVQEMHFMESLEQVNDDEAYSPQNEIFYLCSPQAGASSSNSLQREQSNIDLQHTGPVKSSEPVKKGSAQDWTKGTPVKLRTPVSSTLRTNTRMQESTVLKNKLSDWITTKAEVLDLQKQHMKDQHEAKMNAIDVEHSAKMNAIDVEHSIKMDAHALHMQYMREEHLVKLKLLQQQLKE